MAEYDFIIGLAIVFGLPIFFTIILKSDLQEYLIWCTFVSVFIVQSGFLELWMLIALIIIDIVLLLIKRGNNENVKPQ